MAEPFDSAAQEIVDVVRGLLDSTVSAIDGAARIRDVLPSLAPTPVAQLAELRQIWGRIESTFIVAGTSPPANTLGTEGATAFAPEMDPPQFFVKGESGWGSGVPLGGTDGTPGPAGEIVSVSTTIVPFETPQQVVAGGTTSARTLEFQLHDAKQAAQGAVTLMAVRAAEFGINDLGAAGNFLFYGSEFEFATGYYRQGLEEYDDFADADQLTYSRASVATNIEGGAVVNYSSGLPRIVAGLGILIEPQRTNDLLQSEDLSSSSWVKVSATITANATTAPDGTTTADKLVPASGTNAARVQQAMPLVLGQRNTVTVFAKAIPGESQWLYFRTSGGVASIVYFDLINGVVGGVQSPWESTRMTPLGGGWWRCEAGHVAAVNDAANVVRIGLADNGSATSFTGNASKGVYVWGAQAELGLHATSYIRTTTASGTRVADVLSVPFDGTEPKGFLYSEFINPKVSAAITSEVLAGNTTGRAIAVASGHIFTGADTVDLLSGSTATTGEAVKAVMAWDAGGRRIYAKGVGASDADHGLVSTVASVRIGGSASTPGAFNGYIKSVVLSPKATLSTSQCIAATGGAASTEIDASLLTITAPETTTSADQHNVIGAYDGDARFYAGQQGSGGFNPGAGLIGIKGLIGLIEKYVELTLYQYGATLKHNGQIFEFFLNDDTGGIGELSVRGIVAHRGSKINARNGADSISSAIGAIDDRAGFMLAGNLADLPLACRFGHARTDGEFRFILGIGEGFNDVTSGGTRSTDVLKFGNGWLEGRARSDTSADTRSFRLDEDGLTLPQRATAPTPAAGDTAIWAKTDGSIQKTSNVGGTTTTAQLN